MCIFKNMSVQDSFTAIMHRLRILCAAIKCQCEISSITLAMSHVRISARHLSLPWFLFVHTLTQHLGVMIVMIIIAITGIDII